MPPISSGIPGIGISDRASERLTIFVLYRTLAPALMFGYHDVAMFWSFNLP